MGLQFWPGMNRKLNKVKIYNDSFLWEKTYDAHKTQ